MYNYQVIRGGKRKINDKSKQLNGKKNTKQIRHLQLDDKFKHYVIVLCTNELNIPKYTDVRLVKTNVLLIRETKIKVLQ